jgi:putative FmdB family regulatory protein
MPIYDFKCNNCNKINEYYVPTISSKPDKCVCGDSKSFKKIQTFSKTKPILKTKGFYETDYKK